jgi:hypothetical protein
MATNDVIVSLKTTAVGYLPTASKQKKTKGRPKKYGPRVRLFDLFEDKTNFITGTMPSDPSQTIYYMEITLLWKPLGQMVKFVLVENPARGKVVYLCTDLTLPIRDVIYIYSLRFKIEVTFKQAVHQIGTFMYKFWIKCMSKTKVGDGDRMLHFISPEDKQKIKDKLNAYHLFMLLGFIAQGLMQHLATNHGALVWKGFGSWLRTIRPNAAPSEKVVSLAMSNTYGHFLLVEEITSIFKKFIRSVTDFNQVRTVGINLNKAA